MSFRFFLCVLCVYRKTVRLLAIIQWKSMGLSFSHMYYIFKYYCTCKNGAHLVCYYSFITSFWSFLLCAASQILLHCCFPRSVLQYNFSYLYTKMHYWDSSSDVPFFPFVFSVFLSDSPPPFCLIFYFLISDLSPVLFPFPLPALPLPIYATCFTRFPHKFRSPHHWGIHLIV